MTTATQTIIQPTDRQRLMLAASALESIGNMYPDGSVVGQGYRNAAARAWQEVGGWTAQEFDDAIAASAAAAVEPAE